MAHPLEQRGKNRIAIARRVQEIVDPNYPQQAALEANLYSSSLVSTVMTLEQMRAASADPRLYSRILLDPQLQTFEDFRDYKKAVRDQGIATHLVLSDPDVLKLWGLAPIYSKEADQSIARHSRKSYADFLANGRNVEARMAAAMPKFKKKFIRDAFRYSHSPGPYFQRMLKMMEVADTETLVFMHNNAEVLGGLDGFYFYLLRNIKEGYRNPYEPKDPPTAFDLQIQNQEKFAKQRAEAAIDTMNKFRDVAGEVLRLVFVGHDQPEWRKFVMDHFPYLAMGVLHHSDVDNYLGRELLDRLSLLFGAVKPYERDKAFKYWVASQFKIHPAALPIFDNQVLNGETTNAFAATEFTDMAEQESYTYNQPYKGHVTRAARDWTLRLANREIAPADFARIISNWRGRQLAIREFMEAQGMGEPVIGFLARSFMSMFGSPADFQQAEETSALLRSGIFPSPPIVDLVVREGTSQGLQSLAKLQQNTTEGQFDPQNTAQRDLELMRYLELRKPEANSSDEYQDFTGLPFIKAANKTEFGLSPKEASEARATAFEAALLYWFLKERREAGRNTTILGNPRYGDYFIVTPLRDFLSDIGVNVSYYPIPPKVESHVSDTYDIKKLFSEHFIDYLVEEIPDLVIADGTANPTHDGIPRLPSAMFGHYMWFRAWNEAVGSPEQILPDLQKKLNLNSSYRNLVQMIRDHNARTPYNITFWTPTEAQRIFIGTDRVDYRRAGRDGPQLILANPVVDPKAYPQFTEALKKYLPAFKNHQPGFFDDPERHASQNSRIAFTPHGVARLIQGRTPEQVVELAIGAVERALPQMIRATHPLNF